MKSAQLKELILQALEHEQGGVLIYETALQCVVNAELRTEWAKYLSQTREHVQALTTVCEKFGFKADEQTPGRKVVQHIGKSLVEAMKMALKEGDHAAAELVACDCVLMAEIKDLANWSLLGVCAKNGDSAALQAAYDQIADEEKEHYYHSKGWGRELWFKSLGLHATLPPPEEARDVKSAIGAALVEGMSKRKAGAS